MIPELRHRRTLFAVCLLVATVGILATWESMNPARVSTAPPRELARVTTGALPSLDAHPGPNPASVRLPQPISPGAVIAAPEPESGPGSQGLIVRVLDEITASPIAGARIVLGVATERSVSEGFAETADLLRETRTGGDGLAVVGRVPTDEGAWIRVEAEKHGPVVRPVDPPVRPLEVRLPVGLQISGIVQTPAGERVPGATVVARHVRLPKRAPEVGASPAGSEGWARAQTNLEGEFALSGLSPGSYSLCAYGDGWRFYEPRPAVGEPQDAVVAAGTAGVKLLVEPVRLLRFRLLHGPTGTPVCTCIDSLEFAESSALSRSRRPGPGRIFGRATWIDLWAGSDPSVYTVSVELKTARTVPEHVGVLLDVPGYRPCAAEIRTWMPGQLEGNPHVDNIELVPAEAEEIGTVIIASARELQGLARASRRELWWAGEGSCSMLGRPLGGDRWEFTAVPAGRRAIRVNDGVNWSVAKEIDVTPRGVTETPVEFPPPTGMTLELRDPGGRQLFDADQLYFYRLKGEAVEWPFNEWIGKVETTAPRTDAATRRIVPVLTEIPDPGKYRVVVERAGYRAAAAEFEISAGRVTPVKITMDPE